ncbi:MAG: flagellar basal body P-ring formation chaperone FlgA [Bryobacteraceae bacterium]
MRLIFILVTLLISVSRTATAADTCALVDGARIRAVDLARISSAFDALPPDTDLGPAPAGSMVRVFYKAQLTALLPGVAAELPPRLCVQRKRDAIPPEAWQTAVEAAMTRICAATPWKAKVLEAPHHSFPTGELLFSRPGLIASRGSVQLWRGALMLPEKSSVPVWVRAEIQVQRRATILQRPLAAGAVLAPDDYREEDIWAPGLCAEEKDRPRPDGMVAKRAMPAGAEIVKEDLRRAPAIHRGQSVELEAASGSARLRVPTVAEHDADVGDTVQLKSRWNGTKLVGRVTGAQKAKVE